jgi:hypothetical protein
MREQNGPSRDEHRLEWAELERDNAATESNETFDRIAFAMRLLRILAPPNLTVVFHESYRSVRVERGRSSARRPGADWAMVGISPRASREVIALAMAEVAGVERVPFVVDLLVRMDTAAPSDLRNQRPRTP